MFDDFEPAHNSPKILDHDLNKHFPELLKFNSLEETENSAVYQKIKPTVERILNAIVVENFSGNSKIQSSKVQSLVSSVAWNIERGNIFEGIADALESHPDLKDKGFISFDRTRLRNGAKRKSFCRAGIGEKS